MSVSSRFSELTDWCLVVFCSPPAGGSAEGMQRSSPVRVLSRDGLLLEMPVVEKEIEMVIIIG